MTFSNMRFSTSPITLILACLTPATTILITVAAVAGADPLSDELFVAPSDPFEVSLRDISTLGTNWDLFDMGPSPPSSADFFNENLIAAVDYYPLGEDSTTADLLQGDSSVAAGGFDTYNNNRPFVNYDDPDGSFFDASSLENVFTSLAADAEAVKLSTGQLGESGCSETAYSADLCCNGPFGAIIDDDDTGVPIYSEFRDCYPSEFFVPF